jgi:hypothetical protein
MQLQERERESSWQLSKSAEKRMTMSSTRSVALNGSELWTVKIRG